MFERRKQEKFVSCTVWLCISCFTMKHTLPSDVSVPLFVSFLLQDKLKVFVSGNGDNGHNNTRYISVSSADFEKEDHTISSLSKTEKEDESSTRRRGWKTRETDKALSDDEITSQAEERDGDQNRIMSLWVLTTNNAIDVCQRHDHTTDQLRSTHRENFFFPFIVLMLRVAPKEDYRTICPISWTNVSSRLDYQWCASDLLTNLHDRQSRVLHQNFCVYQTKRTQERLSFCSQRTLWCKTLCDLGSSLL